MGYLQLVLANLFRHRTRTTLTLLSIIAAFLLFGLLDGVRLAFDAGSSAAGVDRLVVSSRYSIIQPLPQSLIARVEKVPGVRDVSWANFFGGYYQQPRNQMFIMAINPGYLDMYPEIVVSDAQREAFENTRTGVLAGTALIKRFGWQIGDKIPISGAIFPNKSTGDTSWTFDLVGSFSAGDPAMSGIEQQMLFRWDYLDEANAYGSGSVGWLIVRVDDPEDSEQVAAAIDALSANSANETKTQTEQAFGLEFARQLGDIGLIVRAIMAAVFFTLLLLTGNTMAQAVRERTAELAILKTIGFSSRSVMLMVLAEALVLVGLGGVLGLLLARAALPAISAASGGMVSLPPGGPGTWLVGAVLMLVVGFLVGMPPAWRALRLRIVDALTDR